MLWFDISETRNWTLPPTGIVRVEIEIGRRLIATYGHRVRLCSYQDSQFVPVQKEEHLDQAARLQHGAVVSAGPGGNMLARHLKWVYGFLLRRGPRPLRPLAQFAVRLAKRSLLSIAQRKSGQAGGDGRRQHLMRDTCFAPGDVYVSASGDWAPAGKLKQVSRIREQGVRTILLCHDLIPVLFPELCRREVIELFDGYPAALAAAADTVMCDSNNTKSDLEGYLSLHDLPHPRLMTIPLGADHEAVEADGSRLASSLGRDFILYVSTLERRKNHETIYRAYVKAREERGVAPPLCVFAGSPGWGAEQVIADIEADARVNRDFLLLNRVTDSELQWLYQHCLFTIYPSLYEGWGLPIVESLRNGKFVISSNSSSLPEAGGAFVEYADPKCPDAWADRILYYAGNRSALREKEDIIRRSYVPISWQETLDMLTGEIKRLSHDLAQH